MVSSKETIQKIRDIIDKHYKYLAVSVLGRQSLTDKEIQELIDSGVIVPDNVSTIEAIYNHNFINVATDKNVPKTFAELLNQQQAPNIKSEGSAHQYTIDNLTDKTKQLIDKLKLDVTNRIESIVRENNDLYKLNALQNLSRESMADALVKESSLGKVKQLLRDTAGVANRDWQRVALTEMSNAIGAGSVDRIVVNNKDKDLDEVYVFRIPVNDATTCKYCKKFYGDLGAIPKLYKLTSLLNNGSNYGRKPSEWQPVVGATHPNTRTSQVMELKPGWKLTPGGTPTYMGLEDWSDWVFNHLEY